MVKAIEEKIVAYREQVHELQVELQMNDLDESGMHRMEKVDLVCPHMAHSAISQSSSESSLL
jgi:hypothetical protein